MYLAKIMALISCAVTARLICAFVVCFFCICKNRDVDYIKEEQKKKRIYVSNEENNAVQRVRTRDQREKTL